MDVSFSYFLDAMSASPVLLITVLLTLGVIFVNGWTDAPNAIATCITTRCMKPRPAIMLSAVFNFLGVLVMTHFNSSVASTISNMVDFGGDTREALIALCAALFSIVVYSVAASYVRHPHQREPQLDRRPFRRGHRHPERRGGHQHVRVGQGPLRPGGKPCLGLLHWLGGLQGLDHSLPQDGPPAHQPVLYRRGDFRRRGHELYARRPGRPEVYWRAVFGRGLLQWA